MESPSPSLTLIPPAASPDSLSFLFEATPLRSARKSSSRVCSLLSGSAPPPSQPLDFAPGWRSSSRPLRPPTPRHLLAFHLAFTLAAHVLCVLHSQPGGVSDTWLRSKGGRRAINSFGEVLPTPTLPAGFPGSSVVKYLPAISGDDGSIPGPGRSSRGGKATCSSTLSWKIPWTEEPGGLQPMGLQSVGQNWGCRNSSPPSYYASSNYYLFIVFLC